jgi:hypothetical protein
MPRARRPGIRHPATTRQAEAALLSTIAFASND